MPQLRNPGLFAFLIFLVGSALVVSLYVLHAPEAGRIATELVALAVATFGAKSALTVPDKSDMTRTEATIVDAASTIVRAKSNTWPEIKLPADDKGADQ